MTRIDHSSHDHPATPAARKTCRDGATIIKARYTVHTQISGINKIREPYRVLDTTTNLFVTDGYASKRAATIEASRLNGL